MRQVYFWLDRQQIELPVVLGTKDAREKGWQPARYHAVLSILKNPVYAGAYAYGRAKTITRLEAGQKVQRRVKRRREDWAVLILDHHESYIDWDVYQSNQAMIAHNENANSQAVRGAVRHGEALLAGLLRCGHCGAKMLAQYPRQRVIRYQCSGYALNRDQSCCVMFGGLRADRLVSEQLLRCLSPLGIDAATAAITALEDANDERIQPVSYTHLDVYKRQFLPSLCTICARRIRMPTVRRQQRQLFEEPLPALDVRLPQEVTAQLRQTLMQMMQAQVRGTCKEVGDEQDHR